MRDRPEFMAGKLVREELERDAIDQFRTWFGDAVDATLPEPNACVVATASAAGRPSVRWVLLKTFDENGFVFATHYESRKAAELTENPWASLAFYWQPLERQVRIEGAVERCSDEESDRIYATRPRGARLGAWSSPQSQVVTDRGILEQTLRENDKRYAEEVPRPPFWGGFRLRPVAVEFWQGRAHRLHDRFRYTRQDSGGWSIDRLAP